MAHLSTSIKSGALGFNTHLEVIIPQETENPVPVEKVLYLLHGLSDNCTAWLYRTRITEYAEQNGYMVVMPEVQRSFYSNMAHGSRYYDYVTKELPEICERLFNLRHVREKTFVAGLSMGGYGAMRCGLGRPDFYAACASFSGAVDMKTRFAEVQHSAQRPLPELVAILGEKLEFPESVDTFALANNVAKLPQKPRVLITCGDGDSLLDDNRRFDAHLKSLNYGHTYMEWTGVHDWKFWEECLPLAFDFFEGRELK